MNWKKLGIAFCVGILIMVLLAAVAGFSAGVAWLFTNVSFWAGIGAFILVIGIAATIWAYHDPEFEITYKKDENGNKTEFALKKEKKEDD